MITATKISYLHLCHRKLWLHHHHICMENATNNQAVEEGKLISETSYARRPNRWRELNLGNLKIDHFDPTTNTIREVKKSSKLEHAHIAQVKYYIYALEQRGVKNPKGILEYPKQRKTKTIELTEADQQEIKHWETEIQRIVAQPKCPELKQKPYCKTCAFYEFCYTT